ncbi:MAG TPA: UDP-N-acetylglucosamine 2-epimerase (non-hydrolyzing) [Pyrinomonadaceae bacterium]|jgi:UDP-N-acetylglucosamine 2-epimerase (non-hydrolysing)|nr:UDP-N-acetylglucosamine 2-epimerase (non-hydrolyzing) [Pyrinomonadaceae bacterium]
MLKVINVVGARPNFMKVAPIVEAMRQRATEFTSLIVHTGQHHDARMSEAFFRDLELPAPDVHLGVGSGTHAQQTAAVLERFEPVVLSEQPDWVLVVGDVNSTLACALCCAKLGVRVAHVEAGLRSRDRTMPEEINRLLTDQISDLLLTPSPDADENLLAENIPRERIRFVGNVMIDSLYAQMERANRSRIREELGLGRGTDYAVVTLHRPSNVDAREPLERILSALESIGRRLPVVFPVHPRTQRKLEEFGLRARVAALAPRVRLVEPLGYLDFLRLFSGARLVLTDSGGIQEETTALSIPCLTLRDNTERPITITHGTNRLVGTNAATITDAAFDALDNPRESVPPLWDGQAADRILNALLEQEMMNRDDERAARNG